MNFFHCASRYLVLGFTLIVLGSCGKTDFPFERSDMNALPSRMKVIFEKTKSICFGRFVMNVPSNAVVVYGYAKVHSSIERLAGEGQRVNFWIDKRLAEIERERVYAQEELTDGPAAMYGKTIDGSVPMQKILFGVDRGSGAHYKVESFVVLGTDLFIQNARARTEQQIKTNGGGGSILEIIADLENTARNIRLRGESEIPGEVGVCMDGAFISKPLGLSGENFAVGIRLKEFPDVHFSVDTRVSRRSVQQETVDDMKRRQKDAERYAQSSGLGAWYAGIRMLRQGDREFNGCKGYEFLARKPSQGSSKGGHEFIFECGGEANNELQPSFDMQLDTGAGERQAAMVTPSLTDEEAVALWDALIGSIRVRPTENHKTSHSQLPKVSLGTLHVTGHRCPQTGWWECADELNLAQPSGIWLAQGELMPKARIWAQPNLWDRLKGERPVGWTAAVWRLAGYEKPQAPGGGQAG